MTTGFMWDCKLDQNTYATPKSEGMCYKNGVQTGKDGFSYLTSALTYSGGFTMNYSYTFDRSYGDAYGYVQAKNENGTDKSKKLSFVGNGGIKYGGESGSFEAAIFDVRAMVAMILNDPNVVNQTTLNDNQKNDLSTKINLKFNTKNELSLDVQYSNGKSYDLEPLSKLLNAVGYGLSGEFYAVDFNGADLPTIHADIINYIVAVFAQMSSEIVGQVDAIANSGKLTSLTIKQGANNTYVFSNESSFTNHDGKVYLQAHWGSGVVYKNIVITSK